ncbi:hypothetical protein [Marinifilum flexuosum]|uniref:hypothetical protein n=1 Tax=Marinifilum flexuosum TaxID=1117708 RepID=UPI002492AE27|nr:hypothetical protein [Marinifilum flexuosum]
MRKLLLFIILTLNYTIGFSQNQNEKASVDKSQKTISVATYKLFPTDNIWTFLKLNTRNGRIWQVQFDVTNDNRYQTYLNFVPLAVGEKEIDERFTLYPTQNVYTFILLDQIDGRMWQVQWSKESENRGIFPIK